MEHTRNPYQTPQADIGTTGAHSGMTSAMAEILGKGAFWARLLSVVYFIILALNIIGLFIGLFTSGGGAELVGNLIGTAISIVIYWFYAISMHRYAGAAKSLRTTPDEDDAALCFASFATFMKVTGIIVLVYLVVAVIGIGAALIIPAMH